jgi:hypothetical protein
MNEPLARLPREPETLQSRAFDNLGYIREAMENAGSFTAVPGWGGVAMGAIGLAGAVVAGSAATPERFLATWIGVALVALAVGSATMIHKARRARVRLSSGAGRRFVLSLSPPLVAAVALTAVLHLAGADHAIPGTWLLLYGTGVVTAGAFSVRAVPLMGLCFMALGVATLFLPAAWANLMMAIGFGGLHLTFGLVIARRHGG